MIRLGVVIVFLVTGSRLVADIQKNWVLESYQFNNQALPGAVFDSVFITCTEIRADRDQDGVLKGSLSFKFELVNESDTSVVIDHPASSGKFRVVVRPRVVAGSDHKVIQDGIHALIGSGAIILSKGSHQGAAKIETLKLDPGSKRTDAKLVFHLVQEGVRWFRTKSHCEIPLIA